VVILFKSTATMSFLSEPPVVDRAGSDFQAQLIRSMVEFIDFGQMQNVPVVIGFRSERQAAAEYHGKRLKQQWI
jgi:hypothetical protein